MRNLSTILAAGLCLLLTACVHAPMNKMLTEEAVPKQIGIVRRPAEIDDGTVVALFFSGGGTRAAAFSYGVLKELSQTRVPAADAQNSRRLLDDVEVIGAVSGGSFTAAYYCLYHDRIFEDFESRFLKKNVERALAMRVMNPVRWPKLWSPYYGRSDMAADYYDENLFDGAKFGDLAKSGGRPYLAINATDMATGEHFVFSQPRFALIGSEINEYPIARAVAASSAVPLVLTPMTLRNYSGLPGAARPRIVPRALHDETQVSHREAEILRILHSYSDSKDRPYIHLVDGGLADNLGMQSLIDDAVAVGGTSKLMELGGLERPKRLVIILVNSAASRGEEWNRREAVPGTLTSILALGDRSGERANYQTIAAFREALDSWKRSEAKAGGASGEAPDYYFIEVGFDAIAKSSDRSFFMNLMTTFNLPDKTVDRLIAAGGDILRESPEFKRLIADLSANSPGPRHATPVEASPE